MTRRMVVVLTIAIFGVLAFPPASRALTPGEIFAASQTAVVKIRRFCDRAESAVGTGFIVAARDETAMVVTNHHVVTCRQGGRARFELAFSDRTRLPGVLIGSDEKTDLAVVAVRRKPSKTLRFAGKPLDQAARDQSIVPSPTEGVSVGADVIAIGFPLDLDLQPTLTRGVISAVGRNTGNQSGLVQFDATTDHGSSGGPLLNLNGDVVGVVFGSASEAKNLNFAVPYTIAKLVVADILATGRARRNRLGDVVGISITEGAEVFLRQGGAPVREGLLLLQDPFPSHIGHAKLIKRQRAANELMRCDLVRKITWSPSEQQISALCGGSKACRAVQSDRSLSIRSTGDWFNAMLFIPGGMRARNDYVRYPESKCAYLADPPKGDERLAPEEARKLRDLLQSEGTEGNVTVVLGTSPASNPGKAAK